MRYGRPTFVREYRLYNPGDEFRTPEFGNRESFLMPAHDAIWRDPATGETPESVPGVMRLRPRGEQDVHDMSVKPPRATKKKHDPEAVMNYLIGDDGTSGCVGGRPRYVRELTPSDAIDPEEDARTIAEARKLYVQGAIVTAEQSIARHESRNADLKLKGLPMTPPTGIVAKAYEFLASARSIKGKQCPRCGLPAQDLAEVRDHIDRIHPDAKEALYAEAGIVVEAPKRKYQRKAKEAAA